MELESLVFNIQEYEINLYNEIYKKCVYKPQGRYDLDRLFALQYNNKEQFNKNYGIFDMDIDTYIFYSFQKYLYYKDPRDVTLTASL